MPQPNNELVTIDYIYSLPEGKRAELIDGIVYDMATPSLQHQNIILSIGRKLADSIEKNHGECSVILTPFGVRLNKDDYTYLEPDIMVVCDKSKLENGKYCDGAPELIMEVVSPSSVRMDYMVKLNKYIDAGVFEYWIVDPIKDQIIVYSKANDLYPVFYKITDDISVGIIKNCKIKLDIK